MYQIYLQCTTRVGTCIEQTSGLHSLNTLSFLKGLACGKPMVYDFCQMQIPYAIKINGGFQTRH